MPLALLTWYESGLSVMASANVTEALTALKDAVDTRVAASPSTAMWQVASSELVAAAKYVVLKPTTVATTAGARADMRVMYFGGSNPNASVITPYAASSVNLFVGIAPDAGVDTPDVAYTAGIPFTTGSWQASLLTSAFASLNRVGYWEYVGGIIVMVRSDIMNNSNRMAIGMAGEMASSLDDNTLYYYVHGGLATFPANVDKNSAISNGNWVQPEASTTASYSGSYYSVDRVSWMRVASIWGPRNDDSSLGWKKSGTSINFFLPVYCRDAIASTTMMKLRQIAYGPAGIYGDILVGTLGEKAIKVGMRTDIAEHGPWLTDFHVGC
jgi:hypothetical protein